ncbi:MAG: TetR/AcrR family transcriptional regulator [Chitinophagales bacterium]
MPETLQKIIQTANKHFTKYGIRSVSMDDIARELGMSKKTIYEKVGNKEALIKKAMEFHIQLDCAMTEDLQKKEGNAIDEMLGIADFVIQELSDLNPSVIYDLKKYYRNIWEMMEIHRYTHIHTNILRNLQNGIEQGLYRENIRPELIAHFYTGIAHVFTEGDFLEQKKYTVAEAYIEAFKYHIYGIASEKGIEYLKTNLPKIKNTKYAKQL